MVGQAIQQSAQSFRGVRPVSPGRDLTQITQLLESAFRDELDWNMAWMRLPVLRDVASFLWVASFASAMPGSVYGFVWEEEGRIVGNVTLTPDEGRPGYWMISNVAVYDRLRRKGIARALMEATLEDARNRHAYMALLQVRPRNFGAVHLYETLGFEAVDTLLNYAAPSTAQTRPQAAPPGPEQVRRLAAAEFSRAHQLAGESLLPRTRHLRPPRPSEFAVSLEDRWAENILDLLTGQSTERWGYFQGEQLLAVAALRAQRLGSAHAFQIYVRPEARGRVEDALVALVLERLRHFPRRAVRTELWSSHAELVQALERAGLTERKGLVLMAKMM